MLVLTQHTLNALCDALMKNVSSGNYTGPFKGAFIGLATAGPNPDPTKLRADYTEATYTGYVRQAIGTAGASFNGTDGLTKIVFPGLQFQPTDAVSPNTILHVLIFDASTNGNLLAVDKLEAGYPLPDANSALVYVPEIGFDPASNYGNAVEG